MTPSDPRESRTIDAASEEIGGGSAEGGCPSENDLLDLVAGALSGERADALRAHLIECSACQELVGDLAAGAEEGAESAEPPLGRCRIGGCSRRRCSSRGSPWTN